MNEKKVIPLRKPKKEMDFKERVEKYEQYSKDPKEFHKIFTELGFTYVDDGCDGYCPECEKKDNPEFAVAIYCGLKILAATLVSRFCS